MIFIFTDIKCTNSVLFNANPTSHVFVHHLNKHHCKEHKKLNKCNAHSFSDAARLNVVFKHIYIYCLFLLCFVPSILTLMNWRYGVIYSSCWQCALPGLLLFSDDAIIGPRPFDYWTNILLSLPASCWGLPVAWRQHENKQIQFSRLLYLLNEEFKVV